MAGRIDRLTRRVMRDGLRRGILEGDNLWMILGSVALLVRVISKKDKPKVVSETLALGESIVVTHLASANGGRPSRRGRGSAAQPAEVQP